MSANHPSNGLKGQSRCLIEQVLCHEFEVLHASFDMFGSLDLCDARMRQMAPLRHEDFCPKQSL